MGENTAISWTDHTWNPWQGCHKVSPACDNCYMYRDKKRYGQDPCIVKKSAKDTFYLPYKSKLIKPGDKIFVCSWSDFFIEEADEWRSEAWDIILQTPEFKYLILTKRPENIKDRLPLKWGNGWPNVWLGVTAENQEMADLRIPILLQIQAAVRFVSIEPMLSGIRLNRLDKGDYIIDSLEGMVYYLGGGRAIKKLDWIICGGESGPNARPMHPDWARGLRDQCQAAGVPFFLKQWGRWIPFYDRDIDDPDWHKVPRESNDICRINIEGGHGFHGDRLVYFKSGKPSEHVFLDGKQYHEFPEVSR